MRVVLVLCAAMLAVPARGDDPSEWLPVETGLEATYAVFHLIDWSQTLYIARHSSTSASGNPKFWDGEINPIMGRHPSVIVVHSYMAAGLAAHLAISALLPRPYRSIWQCVTVGVAVSDVGINYGAGVNLSF